MAAVAKLEITNVFADNDTAKITIDNIKPANLDNTQLETIRSRVIAFNNASGGTLATKMKSKNGFNWTGIKKVQIVYTDKTVLFQE